MSHLRSQVIVYTSESGPSLVQLEKLLLYAAAHFQIPHYLSMHFAGTFVVPQNLILLQWDVSTIGHHTQKVGS